MIGRSRGWFLAITIAACGGGAPRATDTLLTRPAGSSTGMQATPPVAAPSPRASIGRGFGAAIGFRSRRLLLEHATKHGAEFGTIDPEAYLRMAQSLRDTAAGGAILEARRPDGVTTRFDRGAGSFLAFNSDGTIRTFFRPNDGEQYFRRQARRRPDR